MSISQLSKPRNVKTEKKPTANPRNPHPHKHYPPMLKKIRMRPLRAIEDVFLLARFGFFGARVRTRVGHFGHAAVFADAEGVPLGDAG